MAYKHKYISAIETERIAMELFDSDYHRAKENAISAFAVIKSSGIMYFGATDGKIYKALDETVTTEASNAAAQVSWSVLSGALNTGSFFNALKIKELSALFNSTSETATLTVKWGYETGDPLNSVNLAMKQVGYNLGDGHKLDDGITLSGLRPSYKTVRTLGRGNYFRYELSGSSAISYEIDGLSLKGKPSSQNQFGVK